MQEQIEKLLAENGYENYETSAFAKAGKRCQHNLNYWNFGDYLGIGAGAHSKLSFHDKIIRQSRHKHPKRYMEYAPIGKAMDNEWLITKEELGFEFMMNALRLNGGFEKSLFEMRTGIPLQKLDSIVSLAQSKGLLEVTDTTIRPSLHGQRFLNELLALFLV
jgi:oxygen-independent coproporphyrinogen-3 oxidase